MANVALSTDRESWLGHMKLNSQKLLMNNAAVLSSTQEELAKAATANHVSCASSEDPLLSLSDSISLSSMAFSLDDDEAQKQVKEYAKKLQQDEHKRKRYHDERMSANETSDGVAPNGSAADSPGWTHGAEMKFDARELLVTKTVLLTGSSCAAKRAEIREYFHRTFSLYERLFELLADSSVFYRRPDSLRHPLIFYYGHTAVFFVNKLMLGKFISKRIDEKIESTCAIGVDEMSWDDLNDSHYDWPTPEAVRNYRNLVRSSVDDVIQSAPLQLPITWESPFWVILMGIEHERIHLETSSVLIRQLPIECVRTHPLWQICPKRRLEVSTVPNNRLINIDGGQITLGKDKQTSSMYGWDNEYGTRVRNVAPFAVSQFLVSNAEWLEFMADGGYDREELWTSEGWKFIQFKNEQRKYPIFWVPLDGSVSPAAKATNFRYRALSEVMSMPWDWPVEVNQLEAKAFTNWKSIITGKKIRLPTEDEYNHMRNVAFPLVPKGSSQNNGPSATASSSSATSTSVSPSSSDDLGDQPYWSCAPGNVNLEFYASSNPIDQFGFSLPKTTTAAIDSVHDTDSVDTPSTELFDVVGNVWQHTETPIAPLAGFQFHPLYDDFSIPTFDNLHNLLMGGSWISTGNEAIRSARYAFRRHFYQHAGIRYVESAQSVTIEEQTPSTETDLVVANMAAAHYSKLADIAPFRDLPNSFVQLARIVMEAVEHERHRFTRVQLRPSLFTRRELSALELAQLESVAHLPPSFERVLDLGCGAGRLAFELAFQGNHPQSQSQRAENAAHGVSVRAFDSVLGIDLSTRFLRVGDSLKHGGKFHYLVKSEGELDAFHAIDLSDPNFCARNDLRWALDPVVRKQVCSKVEFMQSDAHNFDGKHSAFDVIVAAHLLEEMYEPQQLLAVLHARCKLGGIVVIVSDYHWRTDKTDKSKWLGGKKENTGESVNTLNALDTAMSAHFVRINTPQTLTNMRRATDRVFSLHISELTIWRRVK